MAMRSGFREIVYLFLLVLLISSLQLLRFVLQKPLPQGVLTHAQMVLDLQVLQQQLNDYSAFVMLEPDRLKLLSQRIKQVSARYPQSIPLNRFNTEVRKLVCLLDDPGASISAWPMATALLPLSLQQMQQQWLALDNDGKPLDLSRPFLSHIDGLPIRLWLQAASSMAMPRQPLAPLLQQLQVLRQELGLRDKTTVTLTLTGDNIDAVNVELPVRNNLTGKRPPAISQWQWLDTETELFRFGDLNRLESDRQLQRDFQKALQAKTLILDMRQSSGFSPMLLQLLAKGRQYPATQPMGYARYRRSSQLRSDFLNPLGFVPLNHFQLFPPISAILNSQQQLELSQWYARPPMIAPKDVAPATTQQLVLLVGAGCRNECEWLAYYAKGWRKTLLIGEHTSGDMGRKHEFRLPASEMTVSISASLMYDQYGNLLSGQGTAPDLQLALPQTLPWPKLLQALRQHFTTTAKVE